jgi:magnesium chelatase accessory protein
MMLGDRPLWDREGRNWPNRAASRFVTAGGLRWHVQVAGAGPDLLLLHGTAGATHSWDGLLQFLTANFRVIAPDLPGHGFTAAPGADGLSLRGMAQAIGSLLCELHAQPALVVGHSAGAAIALEMCLDNLLAPRTVVALNGALLPFGGLAGQIFAPLAQILVRLPVVPWILSHQAQDKRVVSRILQSTGSTVSATMLGHYAALFGTRRHLAAALGMMAGWDLHALQRRLHRLTLPIILFVGERDRFVHPERAHEMRRLIPNARLVHLPGLGHLAHEEQPARISELILTVWQAQLDKPEERAA